MPIAAVAAVATVASSAINAKGAKSAAKSQAKSADAATAEQRRQYEQTREDQAPFREAGVNSVNRLQYLMGIGTGGSGSPYIDMSSGAPRQNQAMYAYDPAYKKAWDEVSAIHKNAYNSDYIGGEGGSDTSWIQQQLEERLGPNPQNEYGSLLRNFQMSDFEEDPVAQLGFKTGLDQGNLSLNRTASAQGNMLSGAAAKALTRFGNDYGNTKANESYNRFNQNSTNMYNRLAGILGSGQQATNQVQASGTNMANQNANTQTSLGNARGASAIAQGNALSGGIGQAANLYQQQQYMNQPQQNSLSNFIPSYAGAGSQGWTSQG